MNRRFPRSAAALAALAALLTACNDESGASATPEPPTTSTPASPPFTLLSEDPDYETPCPPGATGSPSPRTWIQISPGRLWTPRPAATTSAP